MSVLSQNDIQKVTARSHPLHASVSAMESFPRRPLPRHALTEYVRPRVWLVSLAPNVMGSADEYPVRSHSRRSPVTIARPGDSRLSDRRPILRRAKVSGRDGPQFEHPHSALVAPE